jgi:hypothetical protein
MGMEMPYCQDQNSVMTPPVWLWWRSKVHKQVWWAISIAHSFSGCFCYWGAARTFCNMTLLHHTLLFSGLKALVIEPMLSTLDSVWCSNNHQTSLLLSMPWSTRRVVIACQCMAPPSLTPWNWNSSCLCSCPSVNIIWKTCYEQHPDNPPYY